MELKNIKLVGFKSFAESTTIPISSDLTAIVGPNGCGKSNVVDAIRWVIGESSAKQLRGKSMADVIFNGTTSRKPVGKASVELLFDNSDGKIGGQFAAFGQVSVKREVERDGQSSYFLNGTGCRRRDILDVFLGTGLGSRSYAIIEQGMISRLIEAKPEEMRAHLEEVAGISKYKERRRNTENRMKRTQENLDRVHDIQEELATQLRRLKRQANAAERFTVLKEELQQVEAQVKALQWQALSQQAAQQQQQITAKKQEFDEKLTKQRHVESEIERARQEEIERRDVEGEVQKRYYEHAADIARLEQQIEHINEQSQRWQTELGEANSLLEELAESSQDQYDQIEQLTQELSNLSPRSAQIQHTAESAAQALSLAEEKMRSWQQAWDDFQKRYNNDNRQLEVVKNTSSHLAQQLSRSEARLEQLSAQRNSGQLQSLEQELEPLSLSLSHAKDSLHELQLQLDQLSSRISQQRDQTQQAQSSLNETQSSYQQQQARLTSLETLQQAALNDEITQQWLSDNALDSAPRLATDLRADAGWELAVETVLGEQFQAICVESAADMSSKLDHFSQGCLTFIDASPVTTGDENRSTLAAKLLDHVQSDCDLSPWLGNIYAVTTLEQAISLRPQLAVDESVVTQDGIWLGSNWLRVIKAADDQDSVLLRQQEIDRLKQTISETTSLLQGREQGLLRAQTTLSELEAKREEKHIAFKSLSNELTQQQAHYSAQKSRYDELTLQQERVLNEIVQTKQQHEKFAQQQAQTQVQLNELSEKIVHYQQKQPQLQSQRETLNVNLTEARQTAQQAQKRADELGIRVSSNESQLSLLKQTVSRNERQVTSLEGRRNQLSDNLSEKSGPLEGLKNELQQELSSHLTLEQELKRAGHVLQEATNQLIDYEDERELLMKAVSNFKDELQSLSMKEQEFKVRQDTIVEQLNAMDMTLQAVLESLEEQASVAAWQERVEALERRISRLGPINLGAITEFETLRERKEYLDQQHADLSEALEILVSAIAKIDRETKSRFKDTFHTVNTGFQQLFPKIFGGGRACLELEENDLLTSGVMIKAQPPGKRNASIQMLSGGEKALTAIALVFAMFKLNPAPFCILDEVDAPLDDVNVGRFCKLVKEMSSATQFLLISHNKVTISMAEHLMGVTMHEAGVSRIVSVDMQAAIDMVEA